MAESMIFYFQVFLLVCFHQQLANADTLGLYETERYSKSIKQHHGKLLPYVSTPIPEECNVSYRCQCKNDRCQCHCKKCRCENNVCDCQINGCCCQKEASCNMTTGECFCPGNVRLPNHESDNHNGHTPTWEDATLADVLPAEETTCEHPGVLQNGEVNMMGRGGNQTVAVNTALVFKCDKFYYMVGEAVTTCQPNGQWSVEKPFCLKLTMCKALEEIENVKEYVHSINGFTEERDVSSEPEEGFSSHSPITPLLIAGKKRRRRASNAYYHIGSEVRYRCKSDYYVLIGSKKRRCKSDGTWSGGPPTCRAMCGNSTAPNLFYGGYGGGGLGGVVSRDRDWPWQVFIARRSATDQLWRYHCGGVLIAESWVLTAAHCITYPNTNQLIPSQEFHLYFGKHFLDSAQDDYDFVQRHDVWGMIVHGSYEPRNLSNDIALLKFSYTVSLTKQVQLICLPDVNDPEDSNSRVQPGNVGTVTGWGFDEDGKLSEELKYWEVPVVDSRKCEQDYKAAGISLNVTDDMFCAGYEDGHQDSCAGDSGSPMVFPKTVRNDTWVLEGIVSWESRNGCGKQKQYGGYVRVQRYLEWIRDHI